jgi:hypothetical protein
MTSVPSLTDVLDDIEPSLPESLFGEECRAQMRCVAARLPIQLSSFWGFECRLGEPEPLSDILFEIKKEACGPALLAGEISSAIDELCEVYPVWKNLRVLARNWLNLDHPWNRDIHNLWLEMDLAGADAERVLRQPNIFFGPEPKTSNERTFDLIGELMSLFERPASQARALRKFFDDLPEGARIFQIGFMLDRADDVGMRLCVDKVVSKAGMDIGKILTWLARLRSATRTAEAGAAEIESLRKIFEVVFPLCRDLNFGFNLMEEGVDDVFGVECYEEWLDDDPKQWHPLLEALTRAGLCLPEKAQGVKDYVGITASPLRKRITGGVVYLNTYRKIHHLKLTLSRGTLTQAKAYLAVSRPGLALSLFNPRNAILGVSPDADKQARQAWNIQ